VVVEAKPKGPASFFPIGLSGRFLNAPHCTGDCLAQDIITASVYGDQFRLQQRICGKSSEQARRRQPEQHLSQGLQALEQIERMLFTLQWLSDPAWLR
jgi:hypothetical protein